MSSPSPKKVVSLSQETALDLPVGGTYTIAVETMFVKNALPKGGRDLVTGLTNGEPV